MEATLGMQAGAMAGYEPRKAEVRVTLLLGQTLARRVYSSYIGRLGLRGDERVLDLWLRLGGLLAAHRPPAHDGTPDLR